MAEFSRYGFADVFATSSAHRHGIDELLARIMSTLPPDGDAEILDDDPERVRVAFVGRPNVGLSTLVNRILDVERMIASEVHGTPRHTIPVALERAGITYLLVDPAR